MAIKEQILNNIVLISITVLNVLVIGICSTLLYFNLNSKILRVDNKLEIYGTSILTQVAILNDQYDSLKVAHNSHVAHSEEVFRAINSSIYQNIESINELSEQIEMIRDIELDIAKNSKINTKKYESVKEPVKEQLKEEEKFIKNDGNNVDLYSDPVFALCPSFSKGDDLREAIKDLRILLIKFRISDTKDIEMLNRLDYILFTEEYNKYLNECKKGKYHHNFIVKFWRWIKS